MFTANLWFCALEFCIFPISTHFLFGPSQIHKNNLKFYVFPKFSFPDNGSLSAFTVTKLTKIKEKNWNHSAHDQGLLSYDSHICACEIF
jgi:hypothetical protein